jgi:hypothetical protein
VYENSSNAWLWMIMGVGLRQRQLLLRAVIEALIYNLAQYPLVLAKVVTSRGLDVLVAGQIFYMGYIRAVKE